MQRLIPYGRQYIDKEDIDQVIKVLKSDWITQGPKIKEFEDALCKYTKAKYAVLVSNGTAALHCACIVAGIDVNDEVITSPITFAASGNCALFLGAKVKFADIRPDTYCIDYKKIESAITPRAKAIIPVDFSGQPCDMDEINRIASRHNLAVIHDATHSMGAYYKGKPVGSLAKMTIFSFHPVKSITTGEGGAILTNDKSLQKKLLLLRTHGITDDRKDILLSKQAADNESPYLSKLNNNSKAPWYYEMQTLGCNYRITDIQCALGLSQLKKLKFFISKRHEIVKKYNKAFVKSPYLITPYQETDRESAWHLHILRLRLEKMKKTRRQVFEELRSKGIGVHVHYIPLHLQPYYREKFGYKRGDFPQAEAFYDSALTIPLFPALKNKDAERIIEAVLEVVK